jgi:hypothetical protein
MSDPGMEESTRELGLLFSEAATDMREGRLAEAAEKLDTLVSVTQPHPDILWNLGTTRALLQQHDRALTAWDAYRQVVPGDWRARAKVIQSCQALGDTARRDRERDELLALRQAGTDPELMRELRYCREQFRVGDLPVVAYEIFEPAGEMRVFYQFLVGQPDGTLIGQFSLGSYDSTTEVSRETGKIGQDERIYHLDWYGGSGHTTFRFFSRLPSYGEARADVVAAMTRALPALSSFTGSPETGKADIHLYQDLHQEEEATKETSMAHELVVVASGGHPPLSAAGQPAPAPPPSPAPPVATGGRPDAGATGTHGSGPAETLGGRMAGWARRLMGRP